MSTVKFVICVPSVGAPAQFPCPEGYVVQLSDDPFGPLDPTSVGEAFAIVFSLTGAVCLAAFGLRKILQVLSF